MFEEIMKKILLPIMILSFCFVFAAICFAQEADEKPVLPGATPSWLKSHFSFMTRGSGIWVADNSEFKNANEPFDAYATEWKWGVGRKSIRGRLYAIKDGKEVAEFWEYRVFWHPKEKRAVFEQFGAGGVFGIGEMRVIESADGRSENNVELTFFAPDGSGWRDLHKLVEKTNEHMTYSFDFKDGSWLGKRVYVWKLAP